MEMPFVSYNSYIRVLLKKRAAQLVWWVFYGWTTWIWFPGRDKRFV